MENTTPSTNPPQTTEKKSKNVIGIIIAGFLLMLIVMVGVLIVVLLLNSKKEDNDNSNQNNDSENNEIEEQEESTKPYILITSPKKDSSMDAFVKVSGKSSSSVGNIYLELFNLNQNELFSTLIEFPYSDQEVFEWEYYITLTEAPETLKGLLTAYSEKPIENEDGELEVIRAEVPINFNLPKAENRIKLNSPLNNLWVTDEILVKGEMKDFFEGTMYFRIYSEQGVELLDGAITALDENYNKYAPFEEIINIESIKDQIGDSGTLVLYDVSMLDGDETTLIEVTFRTKPIGENDI